MAVSDEHAEDIAAYQAGWDTPAHVLDAIVRRAVGSGVALDDRILEGHGNEVHAITTAEGHDLIVRIARRPGAVFESERWPISAARAAGIPAPDILLIERAEVDGQEMSIQIQQRLPGRSVHRLVGELSDDRLTALTRKAGSLLASVHRVRPPGTGPIDPDGNVDAPLSSPSNEMVTAMVEQNRRLVDDGFEPALLQGPVDAIATNGRLLDEAPAVLSHGDWRTTNLLSDGTAITGVVDWEGARGGDPAFDLSGAWTVRQRSGPTSTDVLLDSYRANGGSIDDSFDLRRLLYRLADLHSALGHFAQRAAERPASNRSDLACLEGILSATLLFPPGLCF